MSILGGGVDELESRGLNTLSGGHDGLTKSDGTLLDTRDATLEHDPVVGDSTVVGEATHGGDSLLGEIELSGGGNILLTLSNSLTNAVDLLVLLSTVVVSMLTSTGNSELDTGRVPGTNASNLTETTVSLTGETGNTPTRDNTAEALTLGGSGDVDLLTLGEDGVDVDLLLEELLGELNLLLNRATVDLDLQDVGLLLTEVELEDVSVGNDTDDLGVLLHGLDVISELSLTLSSGVLLGVAGEGLVLGTVPVLVHTTEELVIEMLGEDSLVGAESLRSLDVSDDTDNGHRRSLNDGDGLDSLLLVETRTRTVDVTENVGHTGLVTHKGSQVASLLGVILREGAELTVVLAGTLAGKKSQRTVTGALKLTVRHLSTNGKMWVSERMRWKRTKQSRNEAKI